jgi:hypothetical protein
MKQRVPGRTWYSASGHRRPRLLIEDDHPALEISDFAAFRDAGFDVAFCSGPGGAPASCPLLGGADCDVLAGADVVLHGLEGGLAANIRWWHPEVQVIVKGGTTAGGCSAVPACCSVKGQVDAVRRALPKAATLKTAARAETEDKDEQRRATNLPERSS